MESHHSQPMQNLLHSTSPVEGDQDTLQPQSPTLNGTYIALHNSADIPFNSWSHFTPHSRTSELQEKVDTLGELRLPQDTAIDNSSPIARFVNDSSSTRPLVELSNLSGLGELHSRAHNTHLAIATSWNYQESYHDEQYHDSADASSVVSSAYYQNSAEDPWTGSPSGNHYKDVNYDTAGTSPGIHQGHSHGGSYSNRSSTDGIGCLSSSPVMDQARNWRRDSEFSADSNADITSAVDPLTVTSDHHLSQDSTFVSLKSIQIRTANEGKDDDDLTHGQERLAGCRPHSNSIPGIYVNGHEHSVHKHDHEHEHEHEHTSHWGLDQYYIPAPMEVECSASSSNTSPQASSRLAVMSEVKRERRRQRSSSRASQLSAKAHSELMKPYKDTAISLTGKSHKGRGAGRKTKEKQHCPEHPNKVFRHNSDFRKHMQTKHTRPFLCTFYFADCHQTFGSKNEWKRHVYSQHLQLFYWRCDLPECADRKAYFNRKDLFGQHLKRMHFEKSGTYKTPQEKGWLSQDIPGIQDIPEIQERCRKLRRTPPERSACGYCGKEFIGAGSWDTRMEHVGKHYEKNNYKDIDTGAWIMDKGLIDWATEENIIEKTENGGYKLQSHGKDSFCGEEKEMRVSKMAIDDEDLENAYEEDAEGEDDDMEEY